MIYYYIAVFLYLRQNGSETDVKYIISKLNKGAPYLFYDDIETNYINDIYIWKFCKYFSLLITFFIKQIKVLSFEKQH